MRITILVLFIAAMAAACGKHTIGKKKDRKPNPTEGLYEMPISADYNDGAFLMERQMSKVQRLKKEGYILNHKNISVKYVDEEDAYFLQYFKTDAESVVDEGSLVPTNAVNELDDLIILSWDLDGKPLKMLIYLN